MNLWNVTKKIVTAAIKQLKRFSHAKMNYKKIKTWIFLEILERVKKMS